MANALAAAAAARAAGITAKDVRRALMTFFPGAANPGRGNLYQADRSPVIVDYGHNAAALSATGEMITSVWPAAGTLAGADAGATAGTAGGAAPRWAAAAVTLP